MTALYLAYVHCPPGEEVFADVLDTCVTSLPNVEDFRIWGLPAGRAFHALNGEGMAPNAVPYLPNLHAARKRRKRRRRLG